VDPNASYTRNPRTSRVTQPVQIASVNPTMNPPQATGITRNRTSVQVSIDHYVGAVLVTPSVGEQWMIVREDGAWKLDRQLPYNVPSTLQNSVEGQISIGSKGPTQINGSQINFTAPTRSLTSTTSSRPQASSVPAGSQIYDTTLGKPIWSNGTDWHDAAGTVV